MDGRAHEHSSTRKSVMLVNKKISVADPNNVISEKRTISMIETENEQSITSGDSIAILRQKEPASSQVKSRSNNNTGSQFVSRESLHEKNIQIKNSRSS